MTALPGPPLRFGRRRCAQNPKGKSHHLTHPRTTGHYLHPGHFLMKIPGQLSPEITIELVPLSPTLDDFNDDLRLLGTEPLMVTVGLQLRPDHRARLRMPVG